MTGADKRQRHKEGHRTRVEEARIADARARRNRTAMVIAGVLAVLVIVIVVVSLVGGDDNEKVDAGPTGTAAGTDGTTEQATEPAAAGGADPLPCPPDDGSAEPVKSFPAAPSQCIDAEKSYSAVVKTSEGAITIALDNKQSPISVNNFVYLSRYHFYDGITFHRIVTGFVDQTGDPDGTGAGGPGYDLPEEDPTVAYEPGDVAMARGQTVSGSQLFFTIDPAPLNGTRDSGQPAYPILGKVSEGQDIVEKINTFGSADGGGTPTKAVTIESVEITES